MPVPKFLRCLPCMQDDSMNQQGLTEADLTTPIGRGFSRRQIAKGVAIVLSGYDSTTAAASIGGGCDPNTVDLWAQMYRPPFFEDGMACPPALILWWIKELDRKDQLTLGCSDPNQVMMSGSAVIKPVNNVAPNNPVVPTNPNAPNPAQPNRMRLFYPSSPQQPGQFNPQAAYLQQQKSGQAMNPAVGQYIPANQQSQPISGNSGPYPKQGLGQAGTGIYSMAGNQAQQQQQPNQRRNLFPSS